MPSRELYLVLACAAGLLKMFGPIAPTLLFTQVSSEPVEPLSITGFPFGPVGWETNVTEATPQFCCRKYTAAPTWVPEPFSRRQTVIWPAGSGLPALSCTWLQSV